MSGSPIEAANGFSAVPATAAVPSSDPEQIAKAREAMRQKMQASEVAVKAAPEAGQPPHPSRAEKGSKFPPLQAPPTGLSSNQEQQLASLLQKYKADDITPEQYQAERAKILAGP